MQENKKLQVNWNLWASRSQGPERKEIKNLYTNVVHIPFL
jgi:hypothetical protein